MNGHVTPPLMPLSPPYSPGMPAPEAMQVDLTSTPEDLIARDTAAAEQHILEEDEAAFTRSEANSAAANDLRFGVIDDGLLAGFVPTSRSTSPLVRKRLRSLKLDPPLTPRDSGESPLKKSRKLVLPNGMLPEPDADSSSETGRDVRKELNAFIQDVVTPFAESVMHEVVNEELSEIDTVMRVPVSKLAVVKPEAPWQQYASRSKAVPEARSQRLFLRYTKEETLRGERQWGGVSKLERLLPWTPFPRYLGKVSLEEDFDDGSLPRYLATLGLESEDDVRDLIGKTRTLKILDPGDSDEDEVQPFLSEDEYVDMTEEPVATYQEDHSTAPNIDKPCTPVAGAPLTNEMTGILALLRNRPQQAADKGRKTETKQQATLKTDFTTSPKPNLTTNLMAGDGLTSFMELNGALLKGNGKEGRNLAAMITSIAPPAVMVLPTSKPIARTVQLPAPAPATSEASCVPIIVTPAYMANRGIIRSLQLALPNIEFVERPSLQMFNQQAHILIQHEADLTLSPSTGLLITTLQKLKQRPLPGQTNFTGVRDQIAAVSTRYERLIVLVSEASTSTSTECAGTLQSLDDRDCDALSELTAFAASLPTEVQTLYIAGGEQELVRWILGTIATYGNVDNSIRVLEDETLWEHFLRKAGLNAYAAQAILVRLREPVVNSQFVSSDSHFSAGKGQYGLITFMEMSTCQRVQEFGALLGGEQVLGRVNAVLESSWTGDTAAFRQG
jgi:hypothetical protein